MKIKLRVALGDIHEEKVVEVEDICYEADECSICQSVLDHLAKEFALDYFPIDYGWVAVK